MTQPAALHERHTSIARIHVPADFNVRRGELPAIDSLAESMKEIGQLEPILVRTRRFNEILPNDAFLVLVSGFRRLAAAKKLGWTDIETKTLMADSQLDALTINLAENATRRDVRLIDTMHRVHTLSMTYGVKEERIAQQTGIRLSRVQGMARTYPKLTPGVVKKLEAIVDPAWEPTLGKLTSWSTLSPAEQVAECDLWARAPERNDSDIPDVEPDEETKKKKHARPTSEQIERELLHLQKLGTERALGSRLGIEWVLGRVRRPI